MWRAAQCTPVEVIRVVRLASVAASQQDLEAGLRCVRPFPMTYAPTYSRMTTMRHTASPRRKPLILVVEDHDSARTALTKLLSSTGYDVVEAPNGSEALAQLATGPRPDLILLDLMMPVMDGWEFLKRQRLDWHLCTIPTIVVSGVASHDPRCLEMPIVRLLPKPYTVDQLVAAIDAEISTRQAPDPPIMLRATPRPAPVPLRRIRI
jgi:CheY-like chemotaxis protein